MSPNFFFQQCDMGPRPETCLYSRYTFNTRHQRDRESIRDFAQALTDLSLNCQFGPEAAFLVRDQVIEAPDDDHHLVLADMLY